MKKSQDRPEALPVSSKGTKSSCDCTGLIVLGFVLGLIYTIISLLQFSDGIRDTHGSGCRTKMARYEYFMPGYRFGCYMGLAPGETNEERD